MNLVSVKGSWRIEGEGSERAKLAYAVLDKDQIYYQVVRD